MVFLPFHENKEKSVRVRGTKQTNINSCNGTITVGCFSIWVPLCCCVQNKKGVCVCERERE